MLHESAPVFILELSCLRDRRNELSDQVLRAVEQLLKFNEFVESNAGMKTTYKQRQTSQNSTRRKECIVSREKKKTCSFLP